MQQQKSRICLPTTVLCGIWSLSSRVDEHEGEDGDMAEDYRTQEPVSSPAIASTAASWNESPRRNRTGPISRPAAPHLQAHAKPAVPRR